MTKIMAQESFSKELLIIWEETFETHHGVYLDKGTSLFETLDQISAREASIPVGNRCATIAAQEEHVELLEWRLRETAEKWEGQLRLYLPDDRISG